MKMRTLVLALTTTLCHPKAVRRVCLWAALGLVAVLAVGPPRAQATVTEAWVQRYNGPENLQDHATAVVVDGSGNVVVTGRSASERGDGYPCCPIYDYYTAKYAAVDGSLLWERRYNGLGNDDDWAEAVAADGSGNVVVTGWSRGTNSNADYYTAKYAAGDGALLWERRYSGEPNSADAAWIVAVDGGDNVVVTWLSEGEYYTAKLAAASGEPLWEKHSTNSVQAVAVDGSGNVVVTRGIWSASNSDYYTAKYAAADGTLLWERRYDGPANGDDYATAVAVDCSDNVIVTGSSYYGPADDYLKIGYYTAKYAAADGALLWEKRYSGGGAHVLAVDGSGNVVVTRYSDTETNSDYYTAKYAAADGALLWEKRYNGPGNQSDSAKAVAVDSSGNVVVTGTSFGTNFIADYYTAKYAAADGALLWEKRYNDPGNGSDRPSGLALGPNGMVAITGSSDGDFATVVYRENLPPVSIARVQTGIRLRFTGVPGSIYNIESAPVVNGRWSPINTQTAPASGLLEYLDTPSPGQAFYRAAQP